MALLLLVGRNGTQLVQWSTDGRGRFSSGLIRSAGSDNIVERRGWVQGNEFLY